jgi:hypothetical protein
VLGPNCVAFRLELGHVLHCSPCRLEIAAFDGLLDLALKLGLGAFVGPFLRTLKVSRGALQILLDPVEIALQAGGSAPSAAASSRRRAS